MNTTEHDIADYLVSKGLGTLAPLGANPATSWAIFIEWMPETDTGNVIGLFSGVSPRPSIPMNYTSGDPIVEYQRFQVNTRCPTYEAAEAKLSAIRAALNTLFNWSVVDGTKTTLYSSCLQMTGAYTLPSGEQNVFIRSVNFQACRQEMTTP